MVAISEKYLLIFNLCIFELSIPGRFIGRRSGKSNMRAKVERIESATAGRNVLLALGWYYPEIHGGVANLVGITIDSMALVAALEAGHVATHAARPNSQRFGLMGIRFKQHLID